MSSEKPLPPETKEAQRQGDVYDLLAWLEVNKGKVIVVALALVALGFLIATMRYMREQKELRASSELLGLRATLNPATNTTPVQASAFLKVAQEFEGTGAAERARLLAATALFTERKYAEAEAAFSQFLKDFPESEWRATAAYGVATAQEAQNKPEAVASYQSVSTSYSKSPVADDAKMALARIHEQKNQPAEALRIYNEMLAPRPGAQPGEPGHRGATERKETLLRAHPELATNAAPPIATQPFSPTPGATNNTLQIQPPPATNAPGN